MKTPAALVALLAAGGVAAQVLPNAATSARSFSGQFYVTASPAAGHRSPVGGGADPGLVRLEPTFVAVSCERIKQAVWRELEVNDPWEQKVSIFIRPARADDERVTIVSERSGDRWSYRVEMADTLPRERYLRALVQVVLLELANRTAGQQPAEIPVWLTEGLAFHLFNNYGSELVLSTPRFQVNGIHLDPMHQEFRRVSPLEKAHKILLGTTPLTFEELSWPAPNQIDRADGPQYQASAQLFTWELLKLPGGPACMRDFLGALPRFLNWQMAFLGGFAPHFQRPLDVEKWWSLRATEFAGRDLTQTWPFEESWSKLAQTLVEPVDVFLSTNELPARSEVSLQTIIREWDGAKQGDALHRKTVELGALRLRIAPELIELTDQYVATISLHLKQRDAFNGRGTNSRGAAGLARVAQFRILKRLDALDARLQELRLGSAPENSTAVILKNLAPAAPEMRLPGPGLRAN